MGPEGSTNEITLERNKTTSYKQNMRENQSTYTMYPFGSKSIFKQRKMSLSVLLVFLTLLFFWDKQHFLGACQKFRPFIPTSDLLIQNPHLTRSPHDTLSAAAKNIGSNSISDCFCLFCLWTLCLSFSLYFSRFLRRTQLTSQLLDQACRLVVHCITL